MCAHDSDGFDRVVGLFFDAFRPKSKVCERYSILLDTTTARSTTNSRIRLANSDSSYNM